MKRAGFSHAAFTKPCCGYLVTADDGNLLVVDDERFLRDAVAASLRFLGFQVTAAQDGQKLSAWPATARSTCSSWT